MSPGELAKRLPFSKHTIARALAKLVQKGRILANKETGVGAASSYCLVDESRVARFLAQAKERASGANPNSDAHKPDRAVAVPNEEGAKPNNNTCLKDTVLKTSLEDPVERQPLQDTKASPECPVITVTDEKPSEEEIAEALLFLSPAAAPGRSEAKKPEPAAIPELESFATYEAMNAWFRGLNFGTISLRQAFDGRAESVAHQVIIDTAPDALLRLLTHTTDDALMKALTVIVKSDPARHPPATDALRTLTLDVMAIRLLVEACEYYQSKELPSSDDGAWLCFQWLMAKLEPYYQMNVPHLEAQGLLTVKSPRQRREEQFGSPTKQLESQVELPASVKTQVLRNGIVAMNTVGLFLSTGFYMNAIQYSNKGLEGAQRFFEVNLHIEAGFLLTLLRQCVEMDKIYPKRQDEGGAEQLKYDDLFYVRRGNNLTSLLTSIDQVQSTLMEFNDRIPRELTLLSKDELFGKKATAAT